MANPYRYTQDVHTRIVEAVGAGASTKNAAEYVGVGERTIYTWLEIGNAAVARWEAEDLDETARADDPDWELAQLAQDVMEARGRFFTRGAATLTRAAFGAPAEYDAAGNCIREEVKADWKACLALMERRDREGWGRVLAESPYKTQSDMRAAEEMANLADQGDALVLELVQRERSA